MKGLGKGKGREMQGSHKRDNRRKGTRWAVAVLFLAISLFCAGCSSGMQKLADTVAETAEPQSMKVEEAEAAAESAESLPEEAFAEKSREMEEALSEKAVEGKYIQTTYFHKNPDWVIPLLLLKSKDAEATNQEIEAYLAEIMEEKKGLGEIFVTYQSWLYENILSVLLQVEIGMGSDIYFFSYIFDTETGKRLETDEIFQISGMDWEKAKEIFSAERKAYWSSIIRRGGAAEEYFSYAAEEISALQNFYEEGLLPVVLDEDGLPNMLSIILSEAGESYWQLYGITENRTTLVQRNAYGGDLAAVVLADPDEAELANVKIRKKIAAESGSGEKKAFLLLPLRDGTTFEWLWQDASNVRSGTESEKQIWQAEALFVGEAIYIELTEEEIEKKLYYGRIGYYDEEAFFYPKELQAALFEGQSIFYVNLE